MEALDRRQDGVARWPDLTLEKPVDTQLQILTEKLPENRFAALVTKVDDNQAQIYVQGQTAVIPFRLHHGPIHPAVLMVSDRQRLPA